VLRHKAVSFGTVLCHCPPSSVCLSGISVLGVLQWLGAGRGGGHDKLLDVGG